MKEEELLKIAVLLTCHNRKEKTLSCLDNLFKAALPMHSGLEVFLVDDGSTDGTGEAVKDRFPAVNIVRGSGNLFWNQGMRLAWETAAEAEEFNFYLWLNDDTLLDYHAVLELMDCLQEGRKTNSCEGLVTGACRSEVGKSEFSYGGRKDSGPVIPNGQLQTCTYINGNAVLVPRKIHRELGNLSADYTHGMGDFDYGLRAIQRGFKCYTTKGFIATCTPNQGIPSWCNPKVPLKNRWQLLHSPKGLNLQEYLAFRKKFWGEKWKIFALKAYVKTFFPKLYSIISNH